MLCALLSLVLSACGGGGDGPGAAPAGPPVAAPTLGTATPSPTSVATASAGAAPASGASAATATAMRFDFVLPAPRSTSAGVFDAQGRLLRTLWRGERLAAGRHERQWDLRLDDGSIAPAGPVTVRVVHHDLQYRWDGVVGNSSAIAGRLPHRSFLPPASLAIDGDRLHIGLGYNEGQSALHGLRVDDAQRPAPAVTHVDPQVGLGLIASDGVTLYAANTGGLHKGGFVVGFELATGRQRGFTDGAALCLSRLPDGNCYPASNYLGVASARPAGEAMPTGLAVQRQGSLLAVAYGSENRVQVLDKRSGRPVLSWPVELAAHSANHLAMTRDGDLWVLGTTTAQRYTDIGVRPRLVQTVGGLVRPLALATSPADDGVLWIADGGSRQQLRRVDAAGRETLAFGQPGALATAAAAADDRLCFAAEGGREHTALAVEASGAAWVVDTCNNRLLRVGPAGSVLGVVSWLPASYTTAVDVNRPQRVFANFLEFEVDTARPLADGGWRLIRNWLPSLPAALRDADSANTRFGGLRNVATLANGRTYGQLRVAGRDVIVELAASGTVRELRRLPAATASQTPRVLQPSGDLHHAEDEGTRQTVYRLGLEGFDADGTPRWAARAEAIASVVRGAATPHHRLGTFAGLTGPRWPISAAGAVLFFDPAVDSGSAFHLGAVPLGASAWDWQASPSGPLDGRGSFQTRSSDAQLQYGGNVVMTTGRSIVYGYHGEFYTDLGNGRVGQANQFMHFLDNGLFLGQFGTPSTRGDGSPQPGLSGNAFSPWLVRDGIRQFLYHNDESTWGGVHRWEIVGMDDLAELSATATPADGTALAITLR